MGPDEYPYGEFKVWIEQLIPLDRDYLHILAGALILAAYIGWTAARRRPMRPGFAVGLVLAVAIANEILDLWHDVARSAEPNLGESLKDIGLTLVLPLAAWVGLPVLRKAMRP